MAIVFLTCRWLPKKAVKFWLCRNCRQRVERGVWDHWVWQKSNCGSSSLRWWTWSTTWEITAAFTLKDHLLTLNQVQNTPCVTYYTTVKHSCLQTFILNLTFIISKVVMAWRFIVKTWDSGRERNTPDSYFLTVSPPALLLQISFQLWLLLFFFIDPYPSYPIHVPVHMCFKCGDCNCVYHFL